jgi:Zn-dependent protease
LDIFKQLLLWLPVLIFSVVAHEYAHGYAALKQGDRTALQLGRLTFNPIKHIDPVMTLLLPAFLIWSNAGFVFGGAKPVPVNPRNYKQFKRGDIIVSMAGIATNVALAFIFAIVIVVLGLIGSLVESAANQLGFLQIICIIGIRLNLVLAMFNLLPIPPLDGSHVMKYILPPAWSLRYQAIGGAGFLILLVILMFFRPLLAAWMAPAMSLAGSLIYAVTGFLLPTDLV